jgi:hypothetical protein
MTEAAWLSSHGLFMRSLLISITAALVTGLTPSLAFAQAGIYLRPSLSTAELYDSNIFTAASDTGNVEGDFITRVTPGVRLGYESEPFTISGGYSLDGELYADHSSLNQMPVRQSATLYVQERPTPLLTTSLNGGWAETQTPSELNSPVTSPFAPAQPAPPGASPEPLPPSNLQVRRSRADLAYARPALSYRIDPLTDVGVNYGFARSSETNAFTNTTHEGNVTLDYRLSPLDEIPLLYNVRSISSTSSAEPTGMEPGGNQPSNQSQISNAVTIGWERRVTSALSFDVRAGPRFIEGGDVDPEISANVSYVLQNGRASISYYRTTTVAVGVGGPLDIQSVLARLSYEVIRFLVLNVGGGYSQDQQSGQSGQSSQTTDIYSAFFGASYPLSEYVSLILSYNFAYQHGSLGSTSVTGTAPQDQQIYRSVVVLGLTATYPYRVY